LESEKSEATSWFSVKFCIIYSKVRFIPNHYYGWKRRVIFDFCVVKCGLGSRQKWNMTLELPHKRIFMTLESYGIIVSILIIEIHEHLRRSLKIKNMRFDYWKRVGGSVPGGDSFLLQVPSWEIKFHMLKFFQSMTTFTMDEYITHNLAYDIIIFCQHKQGITPDWITHCRMVRGSGAELCSWVREFGGSWVRSALEQRHGI
jgi:hypothetical protein